jgi:hypothetical protein
MFEYLIYAIPFLMIILAAIVFELNARRSDRELSEIEHSDRWF